jgi:heptaprenylglyceryl phosphate synthase
MVCILLAILGVTNVQVGIDYTKDEVLLALLGLIAIDNVSERMGILNEIGDRISQLAKKMQGAGRDRVTMTRRNSTPRLVDVIAAARREVILVGPSLDTAVGMADRLREVAASGVKLKLLLSAPSEHCVGHYRDHMVFNNWVPSDETQVSRGLDHLRHNYEVLQGALGHLMDQKKVEIRLFEHMLWCSYVIIDPSAKWGAVSAHIHMYRTPIDQAPFVELKAEQDLDWFPFFLEAFGRVWNDARPLSKNDLPAGGQSAQHGK